MKILFRFLGSASFAIILISSTALLTILGTFIESFHDSHQYAALFTYSNPFFGMLLWGFFINILISALRRWPFKKRHIPFLITHLGLLMILGGVITKGYLGTQGTMAILEGGVSGEISLPNSYAIKIQAKDGVNPYLIKTAYLPLQRLGTESALLPNLNLAVLEQIPHSSEQYEGWIKGNRAYIKNVGDFPIDDEPPLPFPSFAATVREINGTLWELTAVRTVHIEEATSQLYQDGLKVFIRDAKTKESIFAGFLSHLIDKAITVGSRTIKAQFNFPFSSISGFENPKLIISVSSKTEDEVIEIPLSGEQALLNISKRLPFMGAPRFEIDLERAPKLAFIEDFNRDIFIFSFTQAGEIFQQIFHPNSLDTLIVYDRGFGGYSIQCQFPFSIQASRKSYEQATLDLLSTQLQTAMAERQPLAPPLALFKSACDQGGVDFVPSLMEFLRAWHQQGGWLFPKDGELSAHLKELLSHLNWNSTPLNEYKGCLWISTLLPDIEESLRQGKELSTILAEMKWPLVSSFKTQIEGLEGQLDKLQQQIFSVTDLLPMPSGDLQDPIQQAVYLSAYLRLYGIHLAALLPTMDEETRQNLVNGISAPPFLIECPLTIAYREAEPLKKLEDNIPMVKVLLSEGDKSEEIALAYDKHGNGFSWPGLEGKYLLKLQSELEKIPYQLRLRDARQISYANSAQPYSYECDLIITEASSGKKIEKTLSMNNVFESWDGYRFYLAGISPSQETAAQRVQIVVNRDPAKYFLTYPGGIIVSLGILLLFYQRRKN